MSQHSYRSVFESHPEQSLGTDNTIFMNKREAKCTNM